MLTYENRTPNVTLIKLNDCDRQTYPNRELKGLQKLRIQQYSNPLYDHCIGVLHDKALT